MNKIIIEDAPIVQLTLGLLNRVQHPAFNIMEDVLWEGLAGVRRQLKNHKFEL